MKAKAQTKVKSKKKEYKGMKVLPTKAIWKLLNEVENSESKNALEVLKLKMELGRKVSIAKARLKKDNKAFRTYVRENFEQRINRIYEALAIRRAERVGLPPEMGATALIKVGQGLRAKRKETRDMFKQIVQSKKFEVEGNSFDLNPENKSQFLIRLKEITAPKPEVKAMPKIESAIVGLREYFGALSKEEKAKLVSKIDFWINELTEIKDAKNL